MRAWKIAAAVIVLFTPIACGEPNGPEVADAGEAEAANDMPEAVNDALQDVADTLANDQLTIDTVKIVYRFFGNEEGTSTMWIENYGERVAIDRDTVTRLGDFEEINRGHAYWDGDRLYMLNLENGETFDTPLRQRNMEPSATTVTRPADLERVGYERLEDMTIAGQTCEHWQNTNLNVEVCFWNRIDLLSINGLLEDGGFTMKFEATDVVIGATIPDEIRALAE